MIVHDSADPIRASPEATDARTSVADIEIALLLDGVVRLSGYDFREYAPTLLKRRITERVRAEATHTITGLLDRVVHDAAALEAFVCALSTSPFVPFRDTSMYATLVSDVFPRLRTYPYFRIWVAGNAFDAYCVAILLAEAKLLSRARIYATEATDSGLADAKSGVLRSDALAGIEHRYEAAGGASDLSRYIERRADGARFDPELARGILFARHDLASEGSFNEFEAVVVRASLAAYSRSLAYRVHRTLFESTARLGFVAFSGPDALTTSPHRGAFKPLGSSGAIYRRVR